MKNLMFQGFFVCLVFTQFTISDPTSKSDNEVSVSVTKILTNYYGVKNALIADDGNTASLQASELLKTLSTVPVAQLTTEQHTLFASLVDKIKLDTQYIADTKEVKHQRDHFNDLSNNLFTLIKGLKVNQSPVYQQYCPMKQAYWLSDNAAIKNPYYGKMMLTCGKVTETLK